MQNVIIDGDWGGDEMQLASVLLANQDKVNVLGATCTFGNVSHDNVYQNARRILHFLKADDVPLFKGATAPTGRDKPLLGDGAHPVLEFLREPESHNEQETEAVNFILRTLKEAEANTITITASGPLTNIAKAYQHDPQTMRKVKEIVIMGGCTEAMPAHDMETRQGNITPHAEFNFQQAAGDAKTVMGSGLPITLLPMNCTHQLTLTPKRAHELKDLYMTNPNVKRALLGTPDAIVNPEAAPMQDRGLLNAPAHLDRQKFNIDPVMHDIHCAFYVLDPEQYETTKGNVDVRQHKGELTSENQWTSDQGRTDFTPDATANLRVATKIKNPDSLFTQFMDAISQILPPQRTAGRDFA